MDLRAAINGRIAPLLRQMGFKGSGRNFRRNRADFSDWISIGKGQRSYEGYFAIELGCHPLLPLQPGKDLKPRTFSDCWFWTRLRPHGKDDQWWNADPVSNSELDRIENLLGTRAIEWFSEFETLAETFGGITPETIASTHALGSQYGITPSRFAYAAARALQALDKPEAALAVARYARLLAGEKGHILRGWVDNLVQEIGSGQE